MGVLLAVVLALLMVACGGPSKAAAQPVITPRKAVTVVEKLQAKRYSAVASNNSNELAGLEIDPQLSLDRSALRETSALGQPLYGLTYLSFSALVPHQLSYPAWFMAIARTTNKKTGIGYELDLLTRSAAESPWLLNAVSTLATSTIPWKHAKGGFAVSGTLRGDPSHALAIYWESGIENLPQTGFVSGPLTSGITEKVLSNVSKNNGLGWAQGVTFSEAGQIDPTLTLTDGSELGLSWVVQKFIVSPANSNCFPQPASNGYKWDPTIPDGKYESISFVYTYVNSVVEPPTGDSTVIGSYEGTTSVSEKNCSN